MNKFNDLVCHSCINGELIQVDQSTDVKNRIWIFVCKNGCPVKYTVTEDPLPKDQVMIMINHV